VIKARLFTALLILPAILWPLLFSYRWLWLAMLVVFVALSCLELATLLTAGCKNLFSSPHDVSAKEGSKDQQVPSLKHHLWVIGVVITGCVFFTGWVFLESSMWGVAFVPLAACVFCGHLLLKYSIPETILRVMVVVFVCVYGCLPWLSVWHLYETSPHYVLYVIAVVMGSDTGGYLVGRLWGKTPLAPRLSPLKTWEGAGGAIAIALVASGMLVYALNIFHRPQDWLFITVIASIFSMSGDLFESSIKRFAGTKDSGKLLPGHGGFLDRADGFMMAAPWIWFVIELRSL